MKREDCPFCVGQIDPGAIILENELCLFLRRGEPVLVGSGIIVPRAHRESVFELTSSEVAATFELLARAKALIDEEHQPAGYNIGWNVGAVAGQEIFHAHMHVIPRFADEPLAGKGFRYWLKQDENRRP